MKRFWNTKSTKERESPFFVFLVPFRIFRCLSRLSCSKLFRGPAPLRSEEISHAQPALDEGV